MRTHHRLLGWFLLLATAVSSAATDDSTATRALTAVNKSEFASQATLVRDEFKPKGKFQFITPADRRIVEARLNEIQSLLDKYQDGAAMSDAVMVQVLTAQEQVNGILTHHENSRLICARAAKTGTHIASNNCQRYDDLQRKRKAAAKDMYDYQSAPCFDDPLRCPSR